MFRTENFGKYKSKALLLVQSVQSCNVVRFREIWSLYLQGRTQSKVFLVLRKSFIHSFIKHYIVPPALILNLMEESGQLHTPAALLLGKLYPTGYKATGAPEPVWTLWRTEKFVSAGDITLAIQPT
jgi:hypothetical protein